MAVSDARLDRRRAIQGAAERARVLYVTLTPPENMLWGTELHLLDLIAGLDGDRYAPLAALVQGEGAMEEALRGLGIRVLDTRLPAPAALGGRAVLEEMRTVRSCLRELGEERPTLVHINSAWAGRTGVLLGRWCGAPTVMQLHGRPRPRQYFTYGAALATVVVANSQFSAQGWGWWPARRGVRVVHPGVDLSRFRPSAADRRAVRRELGISQDEFVVGCLGRGTLEKGHRYLLEALAGGGAQIGPVTALMIGMPPPDDRPTPYPHLRELHRLAAELGLQRQVRFVGFQAEAARWLNALDVLVHPSLQESFGRAAAEAMAVGLPVIASGVGGLAEVVVDGETGLVVPPAAPVALRAAVGRLRADPELRRRMGENGRRRAEEHFSLEAHRRRMEGVYELALRAGSGARPRRQREAAGVTAREGETVG